MTRVKFIIPIILLLLFSASCNTAKAPEPSENATDTAQNLPNETTEDFQPLDPQPNQQSDEAPRQIASPISDAKNRITKKPYGLKVSPSSSPISPEKFSGFHNAVDFEIFSGEENSEVEIYALCDGPILQKRTATGYGGVLVQSCNIQSQTVTVVYGHIKLSSISQPVGAQLTAGQKFASLGEGFSAETDGERKHLHLGIHKGSNIDIRGYVQNQAELNEWVDVEDLI